MKLPKGADPVTMSSSLLPARRRKPRARPERDATERMGVFLCRCGGSVEDRINLSVVRDSLASREGVDHCAVLDFPCSDQGREAILKAIREHDLDRFVVAGCSPKVVEARFMDLAREAGLNPFMVEIANIREQCSLVHRGQEATAKAVRLVRAAADKCSLLVAAPYSRGPVESHEVLVYGNGMSAIVAADQLVTEAARVHLVLPFPAQILTFSCHDGIREGQLDRMRDRLLESESVRVHAPASVDRFQGTPGDFLALVSSRDGMEEVRCGAAILAWEDEEVPPNSVDGTRVVTQAELERLLDQGSVPARTLMVTSLEERPPGRITHIEAIRNALRIKDLDPGAEVTLVARDILAFGMCELEYAEAQSRGVQFVRSDHDPTIDTVEVAVTVRDEVLGEDLRLVADLVAVTSWSQPFDTEEIGRTFGVPVDTDGYFIPVQVKLKPSGSIREGVLLCGTGVESKTPSEVVLEARSAASRAMALVRSELDIGGAVAEVDPELCSACLTCVRSCPFTAPFIGTAGKAEIEVGLCQGCGICVGICPSKAIQMYCFTDDQIGVQTDALVRGERG